MIFTYSNIEDIKRYYLNSFVKFREHGDVLFYLKTIHDNTIHGKCEDGNLLELFLDDSCPYEVDYVLPHKSYFQYKDTAVQLYRIPAKQYCRGINTQNTALTALVSKSTKSVKTQDDIGFHFAAAVGDTGASTAGNTLGLDLSFDILRCFVNKQKFMSLDEAIVSGFVSCAMSPRIAYLTKEQQLFIDQTSVAQVDVEKRKIKMTKPIFTEEIKSLVHTFEVGNETTGKI